MNATGKCEIVVTSEFGPRSRAHSLGNVNVGQPCEQLLEQDPDLGSRQVRTQTEVRAGAEREMQVRRAIDPERVGIFEDVGIAVRRRVHVEQHVADLELAAAQLGVGRDRAA